MACNGVLQTGTSVEYHCLLFEPDIDTNLLLTIDQVIRTRAFTLDMFDKWLEMHRLPALHHSLPIVWGGGDGILPAGYRVYPPKRWMIPSNEASLISLLQRGAIAFPKRRRRRSLLAN